MKMKRESEVAQSCPTPSDSMDGSLPGSSALGIFQARVLEWCAIALSEYNCVRLAQKLHNIQSAVRRCVPSGLAKSDGDESLYQNSGDQRHQD